MDNSDGSDGDGEGVGVQAVAHTETQPEALAGDRPGAFEHFYRDHHARIYNLAARIVGDPDDAADITQEVFLRAYTHPLGDGGGQRPEPWLYRIAVNASYDHLRRRAARPSTSLDAVPEVAAQGDCFAAAETTRLVEGCLAGLTPRYRTALILKDLHGLSTAEIAQVMDVHQGTARVLLHRARSAFRKAFRSAAPTGAGGASALGLAAFLPDLPIPAQLHSPPVVDFAPPAAGPPVAPHAAHPPAGAEQAVLPGSAPAAAPVGVAVAAATAAVSAPAPAAILAGAGGIAGFKVAVAVLATVVVTGGGVAAGHFADTPPAARDVGGAATRAGAATSPLVGHEGTTWTHREMIRERLQAAGMAPGGDGPGSGFGGETAGGGSNGGAQSQGGPVAGGGGGTDAGSGGGTNAGGGEAVTGGATAGGTGEPDATGGASGSGTTAGGSGGGPGTDTGAAGTSTGGTDAGAGGTGETEGGGTDSGSGSGATPSSGGTGSGTGSGGGGT